MPNEQVDSLKGAFTNDNVPAADRTVALAQNPGVVELGYYVKGAPLILDVSCYVPGNPKETVSVDEEPRQELPPGIHFSARVGSLWVSGGFNDVIE